MALTLSEMKDMIKAGFRLQTEHKMHVPMCFWGPSGVGKTAAFHQAAEELSAELGKPVRAIIIKPGQADSAGDLVGAPQNLTYYTCPFCHVERGAGGEWERGELLEHAQLEHNVPDWATVEEALRRARERGQAKQSFAVTRIWPTKGPALVCIDEITRAGPDILSPLYGAINERVFELSGYRFPDDVAVFATANPNTSEYADSHELDGAMIKRMVHLSVLPTPEEWMAYMAQQPEVDDDQGIKALSFFREHPGFVTQGHDDEKNPVLESIKPSNRTCRALIRLSRVLRGKLLTEAAIGVLGPQGGLVFKEHMAKPESFLKAKDLLSDYPTHQLKVRKQITDGRNDVLLQIQEDLLRHLTRRTRPLEKQEVANFVLYLRDLMADNVWGLLSALLSQDRLARPDDPIKRHVSVLFKDRTVNGILDEHQRRVSAIAA